ncbi:MAG: mycothiol synthase [Chloroflexota bacterium]|nr:mycothiol synthase [Chloroflexota bacterium]
MAAVVDRAAVHEGRSPIGEHSLLPDTGAVQGGFALVARDGAAVAGFARAAPARGGRAVPTRMAAELVVDPGHRGRSIGRRLLDALAAEASSMGAARVELWAHHADAACAALVDSFGMRATRGLWQLSLRLDSVPSGLRREPLPDGTRLRTFRDGDEDEIVALVRAAFPEHPENATWTRADLDERLRTPWFDRSALLVAEEDAAERMLGLHWMKLEAGGTAGEVYMLGIAPGAQHHGLGRTLLLEGLAEMRRRGVGLAYLYVEADNDAAINLYRQAGFRHAHLDTCYSLDLDPPAD